MNKPNSVHVVTDEERALANKLLDAIVRERKALIADRECPLTIAAKRPEIGMLLTVFMADTGGGEYERRQSVLSAFTLGLLVGNEMPR
jgi:hypothetical protein